LSSLQNRWAEQIHLAKNPSQVQWAPSKDTQWQGAVRLTLMSELRKGPERTAWGRGGSLLPCILGQCGSMVEMAVARVRRNAPT